MLGVGPVTLSVPPATAAIARHGARGGQRPLRYYLRCKNEERVPGERHDAHAGFVRRLTGKRKFFQKSSNPTDALHNQRSSGSVAVTNISEDFVEFAKCGFG